jgi:peptidoglycan/xylan/chitin deacetylase (PgdA/CDA1 family)
VNTGIINHIKSRLANKGAILMYHQVTNLPCDPWELSVRPENFEEHLLLLKKHYKVVPLTEMLARLNTIRSGKRLIAITFDDGYLDNLQVAAPLLRKYNLPATFFITTGLLGTDQLFWWDELAHILLLQEQLPEVIKLCMDDWEFNFELVNDAILTDVCKREISEWRAFQSFPNRRTELYFTVWTALKTMSIDKRAQALAQLRMQIGIESLFPGPSQIMNSEQLKKLAVDPLFEIGGHTVNHPALAVLPYHDQYTEVVKGIETLENHIDVEITSFAFPYGNYNTDTLDVVHDTKIEHAVTTEERTVSRLTNAIEMPRYQIKNWDGKQFFDRLHTWFKFN